MASFQLPVHSSVFAATRETHFHVGWSVWNALKTKDWGLYLVTCTAQLNERQNLLGKSKDGKIRSCAFSVKSSICLQLEMSVSNKIEFRSRLNFAFMWLNQVFLTLCNTEIRAQLPPTQSILGTQQTWGVTAPLPTPGKLLWAARPPNTPSETIFHEKGGEMQE